MSYQKKRGISPIIATLLLILIAIAAGVIVYAYVIGYIGNTTSSGGQPTTNLAVDRASLPSSTGVGELYVRNLGGSTASIAQVYIKNPDGSVVPIGNTLYASVKVSVTEGTTPGTTSGYQVTDVQLAGSNTVWSASSPASGTNPTSSTPAASAILIKDTGTASANIIGTGGSPSATITVTLYWGNLMFGGSQVITVSCTVYSAAASTATAIGTVCAGGSTTVSNSISNAGTTTFGSVTTGSSASDLASYVTAGIALGTLTAGQSGSTTTQVAAPETTTTFGSGSTVVFATLTPSSTAVQMLIQDITSASIPAAATVSTGQSYTFTLVAQDGSQYLYAVKAS